MIAIVGAGSLNWGCGIVVDLLLNADLAEAQIRLIDIDEERLALVLEWCELARQRLQAGPQISAHTDLRDGLRGVTACLTAISVGGDRLWQYDATHPHLDGIFQPVGDTTGPGGAIRALRHAPVMQRIGRTLAEVAEPQALLLQLTNPLNALTAMLDRIESLQVYGFCHGYDDTESIIASSLFPGRCAGEPNSPAWRKKVPEVRIQLAGNNHFVFADKLLIGDRMYAQSELGALTPQIFDGPFREAVWSRYGVYVGNYPRHPIEFLPGFLTLASGFGRAWGVSPVAHEVDPLLGSRQDDSRARLTSQVAAAREDFSTTESWKLQHSREPVDEIVAAFHTGRRLDVHLNLRNQGGLAGVADNAHLEMYCRIENGVVTRPAVSFPEKITREIERVGQSQRLLGQCCEAFDEEILVEAMRLDALLPDDPDLIRRLMREMVAFQREWIPSALDA